MVLNDLKYMAELCIPEDTIPRYVFGDEQCVEGSDYGIGLGFAVCDAAVPSCRKGAAAFIRGVSDPLRHSEVSQGISRSSALDFPLHSFVHSISPSGVFLTCAAV